MRTAVFTTLILLVALMLLPSAFAQKRDAVDRIVAVVGDEAILASELAGQIQMVALQTGRQPKTEEDLRAFQEEILEGMISDKLLLIEAKKDTSISVRPEETEQALDEHIARIAQNFATEDEFLEALAKEGLTLRDLRKQYREDVANQSIKQRLIQKKLYAVSVSRHEVEEFCNEFGDSIPNQPEGVKLAHILMVFEPSKAVEDSVNALALDLRQQVLDGADFATLSTRYSSLGAGANGGDLGLIAREDVVPEFARAAFNLQPGDISGAIRTQFGIHIIKCEGKKDDKLRLRHILLSVLPSPEDSAMTYKIADSLMRELEAGASFEELARGFSRDDETRAKGGELGWFATNQMPPEFADAVKGWTTPGEFKGPIKSRFGLHILELLDYQAEKKYTLEEDYDRLKELTRQAKTDEYVAKWVTEIRSRTHVENRMEQ